MYLSMRKFLAALLGFAILAAGVLFLPGWNGAQVQAQTGSETALRRTVSVTGSGTANVTPDVAVITLGVQTDAKTARAALDENNKQMDTVVTALKQAGIANADIRTQAIQLYPRYDQPVQPAPDQPDQPGQSGQANNLSGFTAANTVEVTVRNIDNLGTLIDQAVTAGSNQIQGMRFDVSSPNQTLDQAREAAMADATRKAQQLAKLADSSLGQVISITEGSRGPIFFQASGAEMRDEAASVPVEPGSQAVTVDVQVTWELQP
jgi:uncharacterized protein YggE